MAALFYLIPVTLALGAAGLGACIWALRSGQCDDLDGAAYRVLSDDDRPAADPVTARRRDRATGDAPRSAPP